VVKLWWNGGEEGEDRALLFEKFQFFYRESDSHHLKLTYNYEIQHLNQLRRCLV